MLPEGDQERRPPESVSFAAIRAAAASAATPAPPARPASGESSAASPATRPPVEIATLSLGVEPKPMAPLPPPAPGPAQPAPDAPAEPTEPPPDLGDPAADPVVQRAVELFNAKIVDIRRKSEPGA